MAYHRQQGVNTAIARIFNTYGPRMRPYDGRAIPTFVRQALENKPLTIFGDGSQTRSFCYVDDLISGLYALAASDEHYPVNLGNPSEFTILELAETVLKVTGSTSEIVFEALPHGRSANPPTRHHAREGDPRLDPEIASRKACGACCLPSEGSPFVLKRLVLATALVGAVAGLAVPSASASRNMLVGIYDEPSTIGRPDWAFLKYKALRVKVLRTNLYWGDVLGAARNRRPVNPTNPADPAYDWFVYDRTVNQAKANGIQMVFDPLDATLGRPTQERPAEAHGGPAQLRHRGGQALHRQLHADPGRQAAAVREVLDGLERAEQPGLPLPSSGGSEAATSPTARASTRRCATRSTRPSRPCEPPTRSHAA